MELSLKAETVTFLIVVLSGVMYGMMYDILRILRIAVKHKPFAVFAEDILYFIAVAFMTFLLALAKNRGLIRAYHLIGQILGFVIYYFTLGEAVISVADRIIKIVRLIFSLINRFLIYPILRLIKLILSIPIKFLRKIGHIIKKILKKAKFVLKKRRLLLYNSNIAVKHQKKKEVKADDGKRKKIKRKAKLKAKETA